MEWSARLTADGTYRGRSPLPPGSQGLMSAESDLGRLWERFATASRIDGRPFNFLGHRFAQIFADFIFFFNPGYLCSSVSPFDFNRLSAAKP